MQYVKGKFQSLKQRWPRRIFSKMFEFLQSIFLLVVSLHRRFFCHSTIALLFFHKFLSIRRNTRGIKAPSRCRYLWHRSRAIKHPGLMIFKVGSVWQFAAQFHGISSTVTRIRLAFRERLQRRITFVEFLMQLASSSCLVKRAGDARIQLIVIHCNSRRTGASTAVCRCRKMKRKKKLERQKERQRERKREREIG